MMASGKCVIFQGFQIPFPPPSGTTHDRLHILYMLCGCIHRGSHTSAHVLLNLLIEFRKRDKIRGLPSILSLFRNEFNKLKKMSTNVRFYLSYDINIIFKPYFGR